MPYAQIYKTKDGKWHQGECPKLNTNTDSGERKTIGLGLDKDPAKNELCEDCFSFLLKNHGRDCPTCENQG